jgi:lipopolysaccharide/colanic/teichoic acid biosynthesis glycosyltransferase
VKLLHIVGESKFGGGSVVIVELARMARKSGWEVDVLTTDPTLMNVLKEEGIGVVPLQAVWRNIRPVRDLRGLWRLYRFLRNNPYTLVHTHTSKGGFVGRLAARMAGVPAIVHTAHGFAFHEQSRPLAVHIYAYLERLAALCCHRVFTVSEFHRRWGLDLGIGSEQKIVAIPNGISPMRVAPALGRDAVRSAMGVGPHDFVILSAGRLADGKGLEDLLEAVAALRSHHAVGQTTRTLRVWLAGTGPLREALEQMVAASGLADTVSFLGFRDDVGDLLAGSDLVVLPSVREGLSIALLEAMAAEKPIVATTIGSNREVTREGEGALLVPTHDRAALTQAIALVMGDSEYALQLANAAGSIYRSTYTDSAMLDRYSSEYARVVSENVPVVLPDKRDPFGKRALDLILAGVALLLLSPLLVLLAIAVRLTSPGAALFRQERRGLGGVVFTLYKFRTMCAEAPDLRNPDGSAYSAPDDPRVTRLGQFLRATSLDELPQLFNVLRGDMSLVGPRPELPDQIRFYSDIDKRRLCVRPGVTGLAQVSGRNDIPWDRRRQLDIEYVDRRSLALDASLLMRTVSFVLSRRGINTNTGKESSL